MSGQFEKTHRQERSTWVLVDLLSWVPAAILATWLRHDFEMVAISGSALLVFVLAAIIHLLLGSVLGVYPPRQRLSSLGRQSLGVLAVSVVTAGIVAAVVSYVFPSIGMRPSVPLISALLVVLGAIVLRSGRLAWNTYQTRDREPVLVFGGGMLGRQVVAEIGDDHIGQGMAVRAILDDNPALRGSRIHGVRVWGGFEDIGAVVERTGATALIVAINGVESSTKSRIAEVADRLGLKVLVVPTMEDHSQDAPIELRELNLADLMDREQIVLDADSIEELIRGRRVLITGAGGSIGSELARQVYKYNPDRLVLLDRDEGGLHHTQLSIYGHAMLDSGNVVLADIRDAARVEEIFLHHRPEVVLHAAALKHLPLLEQYPQEAWLTNVQGTKNVLDASVACGASVIVNVSTDKAANPICVLGDSKRVAERLTAAYGMIYDGLWVSVRFGNVLGSRGSVIETFAGQIEAGGPITITHPEVQRYFMTIPEASQLVLQAAVVGRSGETLVLDMGRPMSILGLAKQLMKIAGREDLEVVYTGLRPGEKLSEDLVDDRELPYTADRHPMITEVLVEPLDQLPAEAADIHDTFQVLARGAAASHQSSSAQHSVRR